MFSTFKKTKNCSFEKKQFMDTSVRSELHKIIDEVNEDRLLEIYDWINNGMPETVRYSSDEIKEFYSPPAEHEEGPSESLSVEETFAIVKRRNLKFHKKPTTTGFNYTSYHSFHFNGL